MAVFLMALVGIRRLRLDASEYSVIFKRKASNKKPLNREVFCWILNRVG